MSTFTIYILFWLVLMVLAVGNGILREASYGLHLAELHAHQLSTLVAAALFGVAVWLLSRKRVPASLAQSLQIGVVWLVLTLIFEFLFGHYIAGHSWGRLLQDYDILSGRLWVLLLVWITVLPLLVYRLHERGSARL